MEDSCKTNELLAIWAGVECRCNVEWKPLGERERLWGGCPRHSNNGNPPDYDQDEVAVGLLKIMARKTNRAYTLAVLPSGEALCILAHKQTQSCIWQPTIAAAIKAAIKLLLVHKTS